MTVTLCLSASVHFVECKKGDGPLPAKFEYVSGEATLSLEPAIVDAKPTQEALLEPVEAATAMTTSEASSPAECTCAEKKQPTAQETAKLANEQKAEKKADKKKAKKYKVITITLPEEDTTASVETTVEGKSLEVVEPVEADNEKISEQVVEKPRRKNRVGSEIEALNEELADVSQEEEQPETEAPIKKQKESKGHKNKENKKQKFKRDTKEAKKGSKDSRRSSKNRETREKKQKDKNRKK